MSRAWLQRPVGSDDDTGLPAPAAAEISIEAEKMFRSYQRDIDCAKEEVAGLQRTLDMDCKPELKLCRTAPETMPVSWTTAATPHVSDPVTYHLARGPPRAVVASTEGLKEPSDQQNTCNTDQDFLTHIEEKDSLDLPDPPTDILNGLKEETDDEDIYPPRDFLQVIMKEENEDTVDPPEDISTRLKKESIDSDHQDISNSYKSHKVMADSEWMSRLRKFASTRTWPAGEGNRPAPRQKKWYALYQKIKKCPLQRPWHSSLFGHRRRCVCHFHTQKFTKSRFGGAHVAAAKPNLSRTRKATEAPDPVTAAPGPMPVLSTTAACATVTAAQPSTETSPQLPRLCSGGLPPEDHKWIEKYVLKVGPRGKLELPNILKLWYYPPQPSQLYHRVPTPERFFTHPLFVWMPYKLWKVKVVCPNPACGGHQLTGAGLHKRARQVLDVDRIYNMVTETLVCKKCNTSHVSWSQTVLQQLDLAHRSEFRVILTEKYACDVRVIRLLRERGLGNSPTQVLKQLRENHTEEWLHRVARYTDECISFIESPGLLPMTFSEPPACTLPSCKWLLSVYSQDILTRLEEIKAHITSTYGTILKMDSTKKITKKLAGTAKETALWLTSVGNEYGQILISVLTAQEGTALDRMADDLVRRYAQAGVDPPLVLYVDCGCCAAAAETTKLQAKFSGWPDLVVRLDIWQFMRQLALACTTDAHPLYPFYMSRLSACIFEWDAADLTQLRKAKSQQLQAQGLSSAEVDSFLSKEELALHCRRRTRGEDTTIKLLEELFSALSGPRGNDSLGVPLFDQERLEHIWQVQKKHVKCIQDPQGVALYTKTGEMTMGGVQLPVLRCARGSTSLESFHLHLNRFIPGTSANSLNFQVYLLEGLHRWNQDRRVAALATETSGLCCYSGDLLHSVNSSYQKLFGRKVAPEFCPPSCYTGELLGVQYLFRQTGQALQDMNPDSEETGQLIEEHDTEAEEERDEGFSDLTDDPTVLELELHQSSATRAPNPLTTSTSASTPAPGTTSSLLAPSTTTSSMPAPGTISSSTLPPRSTTSSKLAPSTTTSSTLAPSTTTSSTLAPSTTTSSSMLAPGTTFSTLATEAAAGDTSAEDVTLAVDDQNLPGYQHVDRLAQYLVGLRAQSHMYLTNLQASRIIELWESLDEVDRQRVVYKARHQERLLSGRFRTPRRSSKPGVKGTIRCVRGASSAPALWPDCCRLVETIFVRLCALHPSPKKKGKGTDSRWSLILRDYCKIRELILSNARVMEETSIQIGEVSRATLILWYNGRRRRLKLSVVPQGTDVPPPIVVSEEPLQEVRQLPALLVLAQQEHQYWLPKNTAGQAKQRQAPRSILPKGTTTAPAVSTPATAASSAPAAPAAPAVSAPAAPAVSAPAAPAVSTPAAPSSSAPAASVPIIPQQVVTQAGQPVVLIQYVLPEKASAPRKRPYKRTVQANTCKKCGQHRNAETGHSHFRGRTYCPNFETLTKQQWLEKMRRQFTK